MMYDEEQVQRVKAWIANKKPETFIVRELTRIFEEKFKESLQKFDGISDREYSTIVKRISSLWNSVSKMLNQEGIKVIKENAFRNYLLNKPVVGPLIKNLRIFN